MLAPRVTKSPVLTIGPVAETPRPRQTKLVKTAAPIWIAAKGTAFLQASIKSSVCFPHASLSSNKFRRALAKSQA